MVSHAMLAAAVCLLLCLATGATAATRGPEPHSPAAFSKFTLKDYLFSPRIPANTDGVIINMSPALATADLTQIAFPLAPCTGFVPHFHPNAAEIYLATEGAGAVSYDNKVHKLFRVNLGIDASFLVPPNTLHYFYNDGCKETAIISVLNSKAPGLQFYYDYPKSVTSLTATGTDLDKLIMTKTSSAKIDFKKVSFELTNGCKARCKKG